MSQSPPGSWVFSTKSLVIAAAAVAAGLAVITTVSPSSRPFLLVRRNRKAKDIPFSLWIHEETLFAFSRIVNAFGPKGINAPGVSPGSMIASPSRPGPGGRLSKDEPASYFYNWTRDTGLCIRVVIDRLIRTESGEDVGVERETAHELETIIKSFVDFNAHLQVLETKSGGLLDGGLGEPKFMVDGRAFNESWGRPQNDGPAIRATSLIKYANHLLDARSATASYIQSHLYSKNKPLILNYDLDYVVDNWRKPSHELWEEVNADNGGHFYSSMVSRRALRDGAALARRPEIKDEISALRYEQAADEVDKFLESFWNPTGALGLEGGPDQGIPCAKPDGSIGANQNEVLESYRARLAQGVLGRPHILPILHRLHGQPKPVQTDTAVLLAINHAGTRDDGSVWAPWGERCLATLERLVEVFASVYIVNRERDVMKGVAIGRYPEDRYDGVGQSVAHPWFLCTHAVAETLFLAANHIAHVQSFEVTSISLRFYQRLAPSIEVGSVVRGTPQFEQVGKGMRRWAEGFLKVAQEYANESGEMSEQFHRASGSMRGARELTWSYSSFCTAVDARAGHATM